MRAPAVLVFALASTAWAQQAPNPVPMPAPGAPPPAPAAPVPRPIEPLVPEAPPEEGPARPGGEKPGEGKPDGKRPGDHEAPKPDVSTGGFGAGPCWGAATGCAALGCLPGLGTGVGAGIFLTTISAALAQGGAGGVCLAVVGVTGGVVVGAPSAVALGPCASGGALVGGLVGAGADDRDLGPVFLGALPGLGAGLLASAGAIWGLVVLSNTSGDFLTPALILGTSTALALAAGPVTVAGITVSDGFAGDHPRAPSKRPHDEPGDDKPGAVIDTLMRY